MNNLTADQRIAYDNAQTDAAITWVHNNVSLDSIKKTTVEVLDSGLNPTYGVNDEFADVKYIDATFDDESRPLNLSSPSDLHFYPTVYPLPFLTPSDKYNWHGTKVTSIFGGANNGIGNNGAALITNGPPIEIIVYNIYPKRWYVEAAMYFGWMEEDDNFVDTGACVTALEDMLARGNIDVVNFSSGSDVLHFAEVFLPFDSDLFQLMFSRGHRIFWVCSAGNGGDDISSQNYIPAILSSEYDNVISVANHNPASDLLSEKSNFDLSNTQVQISAPGTQVYAATVKGGYGFWQGTLVSAPIMAGTAALILASIIQRRC